jgi:hypothetical protein
MPAYPWVPRRAIRDHGLVALEPAMYEAEHRPDPPRPLRPRMPPGQWQPGQRPYVPAKLEAAFNDVARSDAAVRSRALRAIYDHAPADPRLVPVLVELATGPDGPPVRATAVTMLTFVPCDAVVSLPVLYRALAEDEDLDVRIAARHGIYTVEQRDKRATDNGVVTS